MMMDPFFFDRAEMTFPEQSVSQLHVFGCTELHKSRSVPGAYLLNLGSIVGAPCMPIVATADLCGH